jgi:N-acetylglucosaminyldiphosphoundecaprenol N-acetyl-beta-D-mannosaminyltransferase
MTLRLPTADFMGVPLVRCSTGEFIGALVGAAAASDRTAPLFVTYLNAWCTDIAARDAAYSAILHSADAVYADGQAVVWASRFLGDALPERVNAADFIADFCRAAGRAGLRLYLVGSEEGVAASAAKALQAQAPGLAIAGAEHGHFDDGGEAAVARIAAAAPDLLIVGMGVPLQEKWAWANRARLNTRAIWCVGAMFEYHGGVRARAPVWVRKAGLEWLFRLALEPRRLWRRYIVGNARFLGRVMRAKSAAKR